MPHQASVVVSDSNSAMTVRRRISALTNRSAAVKRVSACSSAANTVPLRWRSRAAFASRVGVLPLARFRDGGADPQGEQRRQDADEKQVAPRVGAERAHIEPHERRDEVADADAALHEARATAAGMI